MTSPAEIAELVKALRKEEGTSERVAIAHRAAAALEEVERDAQRYRWLREQLKSRTTLVRAQAMYWESEPSRRKLDKAIDAAISAEGK